MLLLSTLTAVAMGLSTPLAVPPAAPASLTGPASSKPELPRPKAEPAKAKSRPAKVRRPVVRFGAHSPDVAVVQRRLSVLKYASGSADGYFGQDLLSAVWTFQKVNRLPRKRQVDAAMWKALDRPRRLRPIARGGGRTRVEVDLKRQVLTVYRKDRPALITRVSTGAGRAYCRHGRCGVARTPRGAFRVVRRINGWHTGRLGAMYRPMYFHGGYALHGSTSVPHRPASHGCVRIPLFQSDVAWRLIGKGTRVYLR